MKGDCATNPHYITYTLSLKGLENVIFELGSDRVKSGSARTTFTLAFESILHHKWCQRFLTRQGLPSNVSNMSNADRSLKLVNFF